MIRSGIGLLIGSLLLAMVAFSEEPGGKSNVQKQRVSPKLLKEALALPEFAGRTQPVPAVSLEDLKHVANKLKTSGNVEDADLLERFVYEHEPIQSQATLGAHEQVFNVQCDVLDLRVEDLSTKHITPECLCMTVAKDLQEELQRLVKEKKAKSVIERVQIPIKAYGTGRARSGAELPAAIPTGDGTIPLAFREFGTIVEISAIPMTKDRVQVQITTETSPMNSDSTATPGSAPAQGVTKQKTQSTIEANLGETVLQASPTTINGHREFVLVKISAKN